MVWFRDGTFSSTDMVGDDSAYDFQPRFACPIVFLGTTPRGRVNILHKPCGIDTQEYLKRTSSGVGLLNIDIRLRNSSKSPSISGSGSGDGDCIHTCLSYYS